MASRHQDPFEGLRLDERFVRGARFIEPSAAERSRQRGRPAARPCQVVPAPRGLPGFFHRLVTPPRPPGRSRQIARMVTFMAIIVGMITITVVALRQTASRTGQGLASPASATSLGTSVAGSGATTIPMTSEPLTGPAAGFAISPTVLASLRPGDCLNWTPTPAGAPGPVTPVVPVRVDCRASHIDEVTRMVDLSSTYDAWPGATELMQTSAERCQGSLREFAGAIDAAPHRTIGAVYPSEPSWQAGSRSVACTVRGDDLRPLTGPFHVVGSIGT